MVQVLLAGVLAMVISILAGPKFIEFLRRNEFGQQIREDGPEGHVIKQGTPAMGGLLIMLAMSLPFLLFSKHTRPAASSTTGRRSRAAARSAWPAVGSSSGSPGSP